MRTLYFTAELRGSGSWGSGRTDSNDTARRTSKPSDGRGVLFEQLYSDPLYHFFLLSEQK